ncbi:hypothetical protein HPB51_000122 [Rhipicephalus microplus]|uniref:Tick transposon n=1 Tax=Rhipicephalus microplus TaxID=6941 RepID=A0A9J6EVR3_RHIMP|nr:hypothetical protein HPB51_000122 [Rhipicephalus microplus]
MLQLSPHRAPPRRLSSPPKSGSCHNFGGHHVVTQPPTCSPKCIVCGDGHHTGNVECKHRYARRPPRTTQLAAGHQSRSRDKEQPASPQPSHSASHSRSRDRSHKAKQDPTWADEARKSPSASAQQAANHSNIDELRALQEHAPTRIGNRVSMDTSPDLVLSRSLSTVTWTITQHTLGSDHYNLQITVPFKPPRHIPRTHNLIEWDALRAARTTRTDNPITNING